MQDRKSKKKDNKIVNNYARYSGMAFQMAAIIGLSTFGGIKLDKLVPLQFPLFTVLFSFLGVVLAMYFIIKDFLGKR